MLRARVRAVLPRRPAVAAHLLLPTGRGATLADSATTLVAGLRRRAEVLVGAPVSAVLVDPAARQLWRATDRQPLRLSHLRAAAVNILANAAFFLADAPPVTALVGQAGRGEVAWCASLASRDVYAVAVSRAATGTLDPWSVLALLVAWRAEDVERRWTALGRDVLAPTLSAPENSPALLDVVGRWSRRAFDAPLFVNAALREIVDEPADGRPIAGDPGAMASALRAQRAVSSVPWIFNALLNEVEYRVGDTAPESVPPEIHLSITGLCNIECRFCSYAHDRAKADLVEVDQIARLDFLRYAHTFRLHAGVGEPTANRHLPAIVEHVADRFPHLATNFFTNAVTLDRPGLVDVLVGRVAWINASLNAASRQTWRELCDVDLFDRVCTNLRALHARKRRRGSVLPLVFGSMVLTRANLEELPRMPALCRALGIDRFTGIPYFGLGNGPRKYGPDMTLEACRARYDELYEETLAQARAHAVSAEIPLPREAKRTAFGLEVRPLHDFACIEGNVRKLGRLIADLRYPAAPDQYCQYLWRSAGLKITTRSDGAADPTHYLYPCLGPLANVDLSRQTAFDFSGAEGFRRVWRHPVLAGLRHGQHRPGVSPVCDACRATDTRDPARYPELDRLVADFQRALVELPVAGGDATADQPGGISR